jgi:hypothetical protein
MTVQKRGPGRPATLTPERRQEQLRAGKQAHRERVASTGKVRLDASVEASSKAFLEAYRVKHGLDNLGAALDAILSEYRWTGKHK